MKCQSCHQPLILISDISEQIYDYSSFTPGQLSSVILECSNGHSRVLLSGNEIVSYTLFWDENEHADPRYKLIANQKSSILFKSEGPYFRPHYKSILTLNYLFPLIIKNEIIQVPIQSLINLKAFS